MPSKDSKSDSAVSAAKKTEGKKTSSKKPETKKPSVKTTAKKPVKALTFKGREVVIVETTKSRKGQDWDLLDLKFLGEDVVFRIKRSALDK